MSNVSENNKRIAKNTLFLYLRMLFTMAVSLYTSRIVLETLGVEDFGIYNVVGGVVAMMSFLNSTMATATQRFLNYEMGRNNSTNINKVFSASLICYVIIAIIVVVLSETLGIWFLENKLVIPESRAIAAYWVFQFSIATFVFSLLSVPYNAVIIANEKMSAFAYISIIEVLGKLLIVYLLVISNFDRLILYGILTLFISIAIFLLYYIYCRRNFSESKFHFTWEKQLFVKLSQFSSWMLIGTICHIFNTQGVNMLINIFFGPILNASRAITIQVYNAVNAFATNFMMAIRPQIIKLYAQRNFPYMYNLVFTSSKLSFGLLFIMSIPLIFDTDYILLLWLKKIPEFSDYFIKLVLIDLLLTSSFSPIATLSQASGKIKNYQLIISVGFILIFLISWLLYYLGFPAYYTFIVSIIINIIGLFGRIIELKYSQSFPVCEYIKKVIIPVVITFSISVSAILLLQIKLKPSVTFYSFIVNNLVYIIISMLFFYCIALNKREKKTIINFAVTKIRKKI